MNTPDPFVILKLQMRVVKHPDRVETTIRASYTGGSFLYVADMPRHIREAASAEFSVARLRPVAAVGWLRQVFNLTRRSSD